MNPERRKRKMATTTPPDALVPMAGPANNSSVTQQLIPHSPGTELKKKKRRSIDYEKDLDQSISQEKRSNVPMHRCPCSCTWSAINHRLDQPHTHTQTHMHRETRTHSTNTRTNTRTDTRTHRFRNTHSQTHMHTHTQTHMHRETRTHMHRHTYTQMHKHTFTDTHA